MKTDHLGKAFSSIKIHPQILKEAKTVTVDRYLTLSDIIEEALPSKVNMERQKFVYISTPATGAVIVTSLSSAAPRAGDHRILISLH
jgi:hypothetical protein